MKQSKLKGIAIRIEEDLLKQIEQKNKPRNEIIIHAIKAYLSNTEPEQHQSLDTLSDDVYNELYSTVYTTELVPLKQKISYQQEIIDLLKDELKEFKEDKLFLQDYIIESMQKKKRFSLRKKK